MMARLTTLRVAGFRSLKDVSLDLDSLNVMIGPNGSGKSNVLAAVELTRMLATGFLQLFVSLRGGATYLLHYGPRRTPAMELELTFAEGSAEYAYATRLRSGADESLSFEEERVGFRTSASEAWSWHNLGTGHRESRLNDEALTNATAGTVQGLLRRLGFFHFHDTSVHSDLRTLSRIEDDHDLHATGGNLAAILLALQNSQQDSDKASFHLIESTVQRMAPCIRKLTPRRINPQGGVRLDWVDDAGETFGPAHLSDGTLRAIALVSALLQPMDRLPLMCCIDEPELGLHPAAMVLVAALMQSVSAHRQVLIATQSPYLLDEFESRDVIVAERHERATRLQRLDPDALASWLEDYTLSELYDKNLLGGRAAEGGAGRAGGAHWALFGQGHPGQDCVNLYN